MAAAMGNPPPETRESTGCATNPVRGMTTSRLSTTGTTWKWVSFSELLQEVATMFKAIAVQRVGSTVYVQIECDDTASPQSPSSGDAPQEQAQTTARSEATPTSPPTEQHPTTQPTQPQPIGSDIVEELGSRIEGGAVNRSSELFEVDWVNIIDSGGQPSFHEFVPFFMQDPSAILFTFKLSEALSAHYMVAYYENGKPVGEPYRSSLSNEQILSSCMRSIQSLASHTGEGGKGTKIVFIGTHRDLEGECREETRAQKEEKLHEMIPPSLRQHVLRSGNVNEFIFSLNTLEPDDTDEETIANLREKLMEMSPAEWKEIPPSWYAFELALQALAEKEGRGVLTMKEVKGEAQKLLMDDKSTMAALKYLHGLNILLYYDDKGALPGLVFVNGKVLLDKITELVKKSHEIRGGLGPGSVLGGEWERFQNQAVVTRKQLEGFTKHYKEGIFTANDLIKLFTHMPILAPIGEGIFFIPAILPAEENKELITFIQSHIYLLFLFPDGIPFGVFCALNASLINHAGWSLLEESGRPAQVSRNRVTFTLPDGNPGKVSLVDTFSNYIAVVMELNAEESLVTKTCQKLCPAICDTISTNIRKAAAALHYTGIIPQLAFFCPKSNSACSTSSHAAIVTSDHSGVTCSKQRSILCSLTEQNKMWLTGLQSTSSESGDYIHVELYMYIHILHSKVCHYRIAIFCYYMFAYYPPTAERPKLYQLTHFPTGSTSVNIIEQISTKCYEFGISLLQDDTGAKIRTIAARCMRDPYMINFEILSMWLQGEGKQPVTWATLASELDRIGLTELAKDVKNPI